MSSEKYTHKTKIGPWNILLTGTTDKDSVEFWDDTQDHEKFGEHGQFTTGRYYISTILDHEENQGLNLYGAVPAWTVTADDMNAVISWIHAQRTQANITRYLEINEEHERVTEAIEEQINRLFPLLIKHHELDRRAEWPEFEINGERLTINYETFYGGETDHETLEIPLSWLTTPLPDIIPLIQADHEQRQEQRRKDKEARDQQAREAKEADERAELERLKAKYD